MNGRNAGNKFLRKFAAIVAYIKFFTIIATRAKISFGLLAVCPCGLAAFENYGFFFAVRLSFRIQKLVSRPETPVGSVSHLFTVTCHFCGTSFQNPVKITVENSITLMLSMVSVSQKCPGQLGTNPKLGTLCRSYAFGLEYNE